MAVTKAERKRKKAKTTDAATASASGGRNFTEEDCGGGDEGPGEDTCGDGFWDEGEQFFCPEDCTGGEGGEPADICGDGVCTSDEVGNCDADCEDVNPSGPPSCGDGICEEWETGFCPEDCEGTDGAEAGEKGGEEGEKGGEEGVGLDCILDSCNTGMCMNFPECAAALECMGKCSDAICGEECLQYGPPGGPGAMTLLNTLECASLACW